MKVRVIINRGGGSFGEDSADKLRPIFEKNGIDAEIMAVEPGELDRHCTEAAAAAGVDALVAAGGDGTISTAAAAVAGTEMKLGVLPLGTLNHFARDAGIPLDLEEAVAAIAGGRTRQVDVAEVNGRIFINNSAVGLYPELVKSREAQQRRFGRSKRVAMLVAGARAFWRFSRRRLSIRIAGHQGSIVTPLLFVGNNRYKISLMGLGERDAIDRGELCLYAPLADGPVHFLSVALRAVLGREDRQDDFVALDGLEEAEIDSPRAALMVATDGEAQRLETPLRYRIRAGALKLIVPADGTDSSSRT
ncbi:MAG: sphingosine kinase [Alphaproteobacteria bacterium]|nr:sphingosine kinase [Alphaproteobacteria bacterium]